MRYHPLLQKQIAQIFPDPGEIPEHMRRLLQAVSDSYVLFEQEIEGSETVSPDRAGEFREPAGCRENRNAVRHESILKLKQAIRSLDPQANLELTEEEDDLMHIVAYLEEQLQKMKMLEAEITRARNDAVQAVKAKSEFLSVMSHEIRTPLNVITGIVHLMMQEELPSTQADNLKSLSISADNLLSLINDILDFSKIEEGKVIFSEKEMDVRQVANNVKMAYRIRSEERGNRIMIHIDPRTPPYVRGDELRLAQVLNNLVSNAVKFTRNGLISIDVRLVELKEERVDLKFSVTDSGIGIPAEKQQLIFDRFTQANSDITREYGGSGLGLAIIRRLLQLQGSDISLESETGKGSRFSFIIRYQKSSGPARETRIYPREGINLKGIRVLLVEDVEFNVLVAEKMLTNWNALVDVAENGLKAVSKAKDGNYDIILMDLQMPVLDGYSASRHIREFDKKIPIIALTASASADIEVRAKEYGMTDYVSKPFKPADLFETIFRHTLQEKQTL